MTNIVKSITACCFTCYMLCIFIIQFPLIILCTIFEFTKIILFHKFSLPIKSIEYVYFSLTILQLVSTCLFTCIHSCLNNSEVLNWQTRITTLLWLVIPLLYTYFTINELDPIPFFCPKNYPYPLKNYYNVCIVKTSNLIFMWLMLFITLCFTIQSFIPVHKIDDWHGVKINKYFHKGKGKEDKEEKEKEGEIEKDEKEKDEKEKDQEGKKKKEPVV